MRLEDGSRYAEFEQAIIADYEPITAIEYQLIIRLASLLWRLRRSVAIESGLFQIHDQINRKWRLRKKNERLDGSLEIFHKLINQPREQSASNHEFNGLPSRSVSQSTSQCLYLARSFLRLADLNGGALERITHYEVSLWRQAAQTLMLLESFRRGLAQTIREGGY